MKYLLSALLFLVLLPVLVHGQQNHVPNGSFEYYTSCPTTWINAPATHCPPWGIINSADYFHACAGYVPINLQGYQHAANGNGYVGMSGYLRGLNSREMIKSPIAPLRTGFVYEVSLSASVANQSTYGGNGLGVFFYNNGAHNSSLSNSVSQLLAIGPHVSYSNYGPLIDTQNWMRLSGRFMADSAYDNIIVGDLLYDSLQTVDTLRTGGNTGAYYYIDSIVIKIVDSCYFTLTDSLLCASDTFSVKFKTGYIYQSNNVFTVQLSDKNGSFISPINIGSLSSTDSGTINCIVPVTIANGNGYRIRLVSSNHPDTTNNNGFNLKIANPDSSNIMTSTSSPNCSGNNVQLYASTNIPSTNYTWSGPLSFNSTLQNPTLINASSQHNGNYYVTINFYGCTMKDTLPVIVYPIPATPAVSFNNPMCVGETLQLNASTVSGATYNWTGVGNYTSTQQNPIRGNMQFSDTGTYSVTASANGCTSPAGSVNVNINPVPFVVIFPTPGDSICVGDRVNFTALPNNHGGTPAYQWYVNGQASGTGTVFSTTTLNNQDVVRVDMTESTKCNIPYTDPSNDITMNVLPWLAPSVSISVRPNRPLKENEYATFTATATNAGNNPQYQWKRNGQDIVGATGSVWSANTLNDNDSISVEVISSYKCPQPPGALSKGIVVKVLTGVARLNDMNELVLYPNPNNGKFVLKGEALTGEVLKLEVINAMGQVIYRNEITTTNGNIYKEINMQQASAGLYMLKIRGRTGATLLRFTVE